MDMWLATELVMHWPDDDRAGPNQAERDLMLAKTQQKISGRLCSEQVTRDRYAIRDDLAGNSWMPPIPDPP
jgi:hypothetical protein